MVSHPNILPTKGLYPNYTRGHLQYVDHCNIYAGGGLKWESQWIVRPDMALLACIFDCRFRTYVEPEHDHCNAHGVPFDNKDYL